MKNAIEVKNLSVYYNSHPAVSDVSFSVAEGEIAMLIGPNASGKTSVLKAILGLTPYQGKVLVFEKEIQESYLYLGYVPQRFSFDKTLPITTQEAVSMPLIHCKEVKEEKQNKLIRALKKVNAENLIETQLKTLSGGQLQRILLARALIHNPKLLILDEPETGIDIGGEQTLYELLKTLAEKENITILVTSHELDIVCRYATKVICINKKLICQGKPGEVLSTEIFEKLYGQHLSFYERNR